MKVLSLFDGIACGRVALERAKIPIEEYHAFEIDKYAIQTSLKNYPNIVQHGDVFKGDFTQFQGFDLLIGGSPCTQWSIAKRNRETTPDGIGSQLFLQYVRALKESKCKYFLYENNYSIHDDIKAFISNELGVQPIMINSALLSGQQRKRCYWTNIPNVTQPQDKGIIVKDILETQVVIPETPPETSDRPIRLGEYGKGGQGQRIYSVYGKSVTMSANGGGQGAKTGLYRLDLPDGNTIIRKLTPLEAERCQTLPDNYTAGISDTQRYKCVGNGWTVDVIAHILKGLKEKYK